MDIKAGIQALKARVVDYYRDQDEREFATAYDFPEVDMGLFNKETYRMAETFGKHWSVVFNTRLPLFADIRVREALTLAYNFDWGNPHPPVRRPEAQQHVLPGLGDGFARPAVARGAGAARAAAGARPERVFTREFALPETDGYGRNREALLRAGELLDEAGWVVRDFRRVNEATGERFRFEIMVQLREHERMLVPYVENLKRLGIQATVRRVEANIHTNRARRYEFDMTMQMRSTRTASRGRRSCAT